MSIKDWHFGEVKRCKDRKCGKQFIAYWGKRGQEQLYCCTAHAGREGQARWRDRKQMAAIIVYEPPL